MYKDGAKQGLGHACSNALNFSTRTGCRLRTPRGCRARKPCKVEQRAADTFNNHRLRLFRPQAERSKLTTSLKAFALFRTHSTHWQPTSVGLIKWSVAISCRWTSKTYVSHYDNMWWYDLTAKEPRWILKSE